MEDKGTKGIAVASEVGLGVLNLDKPVNFLQNSGHENDAIIFHGFSIPVCRRFAGSLGG